MPLYEYRCQQCDDTFEVIQRFSDEPLKVHEGCGGPVERLISPPALQFKGTGWYVTDYARSGAQNGKQDAKSEAKDPVKDASPKSDAKADSKPAPATTAKPDKK